jgi:nucleotide-binding universal stress UspA family protein
VDVPEGVVAEDGDPVSVLQRVAGERSADLIVGSTSHQLAERAPCLLVIIPPEATVPGLT